MESQYGVMQSANFPKAQDTFRSFIITTSNQVLLCISEGILGAPISQGFLAGLIYTAIFQQVTNSDCIERHLIPQDVYF